MMKMLLSVCLFALCGCGSNASYSVSASSSDDVMSARQAPIMSDNTPIIKDELVKETEQKENSKKQDK